MTLYSDRGMSPLENSEKTNLELDMANEKSDETDEPKEINHVTFLHLAILVYSIVFHFVDVGYDIYVAQQYFVTKRFSYFVCTVVFTLIPSIIIALISIRMYVDDYKESNNFRFAFVRISLCVLGVILQSAPLIRYCDSVWYVIMSLWAKYYSKKEEEEERYYMKTLNEDSDVAFLRVFECYLESAPQQVLQIVMLVLDYIQGSKQHSTNQVVILTLSLVFMGFCMANYHRSIRFDQKDKKNISISGLVVQFFWHFNFTVSRILSIAALAILYPIWALVAVACHWCLMTVWLLISCKTMFCGRSQFLDFLFSASVGLIYIFNFITMKEGSTRKSYTFYYMLCFLENGISAIIWAVMATSVIKNWLYYTFAVLPIVTSVLSILFLIIYYKFLHPNLQKDVRDGEAFSEGQNKFQDLKIAFTDDEY